MDFISILKEVYNSTKNNNTTAITQIVCKKCGQSADLKKINDFCIDIELLNIINKNISACPKWYFDQTLDTFQDEL